MGRGVLLTTESASQIAAATLESMHGIRDQLPWQLPEAGILPVQFCRVKLSYNLPANGSATAERVNRAGTAYGDTLTVYDVQGNSLASGTVGWAVKPHDESDWEMVGAVGVAADLIREGKCHGSISDGAVGKVTLWHWSGGVMVASTDPDIDALNWVPGFGLLDGQKVAVAWEQYESRWTIISAGLPPC